MGAGHSVQEKQSLKEEIYAYWPGLEQQLEMAFTCHDLEKKGKVNLEVAEQVVRHLLMQYGLIEYVARFCTPEGQLDMVHIKGDVKEFKIPLSLFGETMIAMSDFKSYAVIWLKKILDTFKDDQIKWAEKLKKEQEAQTVAYQSAMEEFQRSFSDQQMMYKQGMLEQQKQILEWNKLLEETQKTQKEVYDAECKRLEEIQHREATKADRQRQDEIKLVQQYQKELKFAGNEEAGTICYVYPPSVTPYGACASAGAQEPVRRRSPYPRKPEHLKGIRAMC